MSITAQQKQAIELIGEGKSIAASAQAVGVTRQTVHRWLKESHFRAAYNAWRADVQEGARARLLALIEPAINTMAKHLEADDLRAASLLLKSLGLLQPIPPGPDDPRSVALQRQMAKDRDEVEILTGSPVR